MLLGSRSTPQLITLLHGFSVELLESMDLWLLERPAGVEQHVGIWRLHQAVLYLSDDRVVKAVPGPGRSAVAQSRVVTHVQMARMVLEKDRDN